MLTVVASLLNYRCCAMNFLIDHVVVPSIDLNQIGLVNKISFS